MIKVVDKKLVKECNEKLLIVIGENLDKERLTKTPDSITNMLEEIFMRISYRNDKIAITFDCIAVF
jgi:GTP cyclohydrolase I